MSRACGLALRRAVGWSVSRQRGTSCEWVGMVAACGRLGPSRKVGRTMCAKWA